VSSSDWSFDVPDGTVLKGLRWDTEDPRGLVYLVHGLAEHIGRYDAFATALNAAGFSVAGHDQRGHGRTAAEDGSLGHFGDHDSWTSMVNDARIGVTARRATQPALPMILFGHSLVSFIVPPALWSWPVLVNGAVMSASNGPPRTMAGLGRVIARIERLRLGPRGRSRLIHGLAFDDMNKAFKPNRTDHAWLSRDTRTVDRYIADPDCGFVASTASWISLLDALPGLVSSAHVQLVPKGMPVHLASGSRDPAGDFGKGVERLQAIYKGAGMTDVTLRLYDGARHEILNETNRDEVTRDLVGRMAEMLESRAAT